ncbi:hypothetical protein [Flavobacterium litorale]|uniref:Lipid/polyisoprenoid-binding YceI-like domain-containing protein n=1 Tax=Flavobacterium litorale TaxID=2856519 RepID=A0ABX8V3E5_9FLAO|nr:hypothetical protein [Flavobacterium litorale]QYJ67365.1 hypothetical protein K1I41_07245 [Flavobacterium litorale]
MADFIKNIYKISLLLTLTLCGTNEIKAQFTIESPYEGTWHYQDGNELFIVSLWKEQNGTFNGHYKKTEYSNGTIGATIFNSNKTYNNGFKFDTIIFGNFNLITGTLSGSIHDNTIENNPEDYKSGRFRMKITSNCTNCPTTATWKVEERPGLRIDGIFIPGFSIPTDVVLTKVSDEIDLD